MKKILSFLLVLSLLLFTVSVYAYDAPAWDAPLVEIEQAIAAYTHAFHGGTGDLHTERITENLPDGIIGIIEVTGDVVGVTRGLNIAHPNVHINWDARLVGNIADEPMLTTNSVTFVGTNTTRLDNESGLALMATDVIFNDGIIYAPQAIKANSLIVDGGAILGDVYLVGNGVTLHGGVIEGAIVMSYANAILDMHGGRITAPYIDAGWRIWVRNNASLFVADVSSLENRVIHVASTATALTQGTASSAVEITRTLSNFISDANGTWIVRGDVTLSEGDIPIERTLWIPMGSSLDIQTNGFRLAGGTIVVEGRVVLHNNLRYENWVGYVTGALAGELAGAWPRESESNGTNTSWFESLSEWLPWIVPGIIIAFNVFVIVFYALGGGRWLCTLF